MDRAAILIAESTSRALVRSVLQSAEFEIVSFEELTPLLRWLRRDECRLVVVDVNTPGEDWRAVFAQLREQAVSQCLVIGVGSRPESASTALDAGADDFVHTPLSCHELHSRIQAALRRSERDRQSGCDLYFGPCHLDSSAAKLMSAKREIALTARENALASALFHRPGAMVSRRSLSRIWEVDEDMASHSIEQHIYMLRRKLKLCVGDALVLRSVYGRGYRLELVVPEDAKSNTADIAFDWLDSDLACAIPATTTATCQPVQAEALSG